MTYEYACSACGHEWEAEQSIREAPLKKCPKCGKLQAKRMISRGAGFILKGGGWYADGYGSSKGGSSSDGSEKPAPKAEDKKGSGDTGGGAASSTSESSSKTATKTATA
jgi:putative FmdB family regulatory protein